MSALLRIFALIWRSERASMARGSLMAVVVLVAGVALLGLSGWFITAAAAAGLAGMGILFNIFAPSAGVRLLALGRTGARYAERLWTHDAVLKSLTHLRVRLLRALLRLPYPRLARLRGAEALNRLVADVNALDGIALRLFIPAIALFVVLAVGFIALWILVDVAVAAWVIGSFSVGAGGAYFWVMQRADRPSRLAEKAQQAFRIRLIDTLRARDDLLVYGRFSDQKDAIHAAETRMVTQLRQSDRIERRAGFILSLCATLAAAGALWIGAKLVHQNLVSPAQAALGFFAALALAETTGALQRGLADFGRMRHAARNVTRLMSTPAQAIPSAALPDRTRTTDALRLSNVSYTHPGAQRPVIQGFDLTLQAGQIIALTGPSGSGKSTILSLSAGLEHPNAGQISLFGQDIAKMSESELRKSIAFLPQRSMLLGASFFEALALADPDVTENTAWEVLTAVSLTQTVEERGGLHAPLLENGAGLSGGERRRLALARTLLRKPKLLLLDEPTEGLDSTTAQEVLAGIRAFLPHSSILAASHRHAERSWADHETPVS